MRQPQAAVRTQAGVGLGGRRNGGQAALHTMLVKRHVSHSIDVPLLLQLPKRTCESSPICLLSMAWVGSRGERGRGSSGGWV